MNIDAEINMNLTQFSVKGFITENHIKSNIVCKFK